MIVGKLPVGPNCGGPRVSLNVVERTSEHDKVTVTSVSFQDNKPNNQQSALLCRFERLLGENRECGKNLVCLNSVTRRDAVAGFGEAPRGEHGYKSFTPSRHRCAQDMLAEASKHDRRSTADTVSRHEVCPVILIA